MAAAEALKTRSSVVRSPITSRWVFLSTRAAIAAVASLYFARQLRLPEAYWAPMSTLIVLQSEVGSIFQISLKQVVGTALGCAAAMALEPYFGPNVLVYGAAVFVTGILCSAMRLDRAAYRFAATTLTIVMLIPRSTPVWVAGTHRFIEVSVGIAMGLLVAKVWPEKVVPAGRESQSLR